MARRKRLITRSPLERYESGPFRFPEDERPSLLKLLHTAGNIYAQERFLWGLERLVGLYRGVKAREDLYPVSSATRRELRKLHRLLERTRLALDPGIALRQTDKGTEWDLASQLLQDKMRAKVANSIYPALATWLKDLLATDRWCRKLPYEVRYLVTFERVLADISALVEIASTPTKEEARGGAPGALTKRQFVRHIVRDYWRHFGRLPSRAKSTDFEKLIGNVLETVGYESGDAYEVMRRAVRAVKDEGPPKLPQKGAGY